MSTSRPAPGSRRAPQRSTGQGSTRPRGGRRRWAKRIGLVVLGGLVLVIGAFVIAYARTDIPSPNAAFQSQTTFVYYADGKTVLGKFAQQDRQIVPLADMGRYTDDAAIAAEDRSFYTNKGIDPKGILRAAFSNVRGNPTQGASTITQQYVKVLYLTQERSYTRKVKEAMLSLKLQRERSKDEILEGYLNTIYFGRGAYGVEAAARAYFGIPAAKLNLKQSAVLAAVLNSPNAYDPAKGKEARQALLGRYTYVLSGMRSLGAITDEDFDKASRRLPKFPKIRTQSGYTGQNGYVLQMVREQLAAMDYSDAEIDGGGLRITTTIEKKTMEAASAAVDDQRPPGLKQLHIAVASVDPANGALRGMFAGAPYEKTNGGINWAVSGGAPGSAMKPFAMAAGLKDGYSLKSTFQGNSPIEVGDTEFKNEGEGTGEDLGASVDFTRCLALSINTCFIDLTDAMDGGAKKIYDMMRAMGLPAKTDGKPNGLRPETGISLGSATMSPIDMANSYGTIAAGGVAKKWYVVEKINNADGDNLYKHKVKTTRVLDEDRTADLTYAMQQVVKAGTGRNALALERPAAGKTGTATDEEGHVRSSWFCGFTPQLVTTVMYVRGDGNGALDGYMPSYFGADYPTRTWTATMARALEGEPVEDFPPAANVEATKDDHEPLPTFTPKPKPPPKPKPTKTAAPSPTPEPTPTQLPSKTPGPPSKTPPPEPTPTETVPPPGRPRPSG